MPMLSQQMAEAFEGQANAVKSLYIVRIIEPELCLSCRFAALATVTMADGRTQRMMSCTRELCDNHEYTDMGDVPVSQEIDRP